MAGLNIAALLNWKTTVILLNPVTGKPILDDKGKVVEVYMRVIGDDELDKAHRASRIASATIRKELGDIYSEAYKDRVEPIIDASREDCESIIRQFRTSNLEAEARAKIVRPDLPEIEEFAVVPDAPTLEEQEQLDEAIVKQEEKYKKAIEQYVIDRTAVIDAELLEIPDEELKDLAKEEVVGIIALSEFFNELMNQKVQRGTFTDKEYTQKAWETVEAFRGEIPGIRQQLIDKYLLLETDSENIKK